MKHREPPLPVRFGPNPALDGSVRLRRALGALNSADDLGGIAQLSELRDGDERLFARATYFANKFAIDRNTFGKHLQRATNQVQKVVVQPTRDSPIDDCLAAWSQPEAAALWDGWWNPTIRRADRAAYEASKAVMVALAGTGHGPHVRNVHDFVGKCPEFIEHFAGLAIRSPRLTARTTEEALTLRGYSSVTRHFGKLTPGLSYLAMGANIAVVRELDRMFPDAQICRFASADGDLVAAWAQQRSSWDRQLGNHNDATERWLTRRTPEAGFRAFTYTLDGPEDVTPNRKQRRAISKAVRGYNLLALVELRTGIPLVWMMDNAATLHEPRMIGLLLDLLFQLWPDCPLQAVVADKLWDEHEAHEFCAVQYGVALTAVRKKSHREHGGKSWATTAKDETGHGSLLRISGQGIAYCRKHDKPLAYLGSEWPSRRGIAPGEPVGSEADARRKRFRSRWTGEGACGCGRLSAATSVSWSALPLYPHHPYGRPDLFAMRVALLAARNTAESAFSSAEIAFKQALASGVRTRLLDKDTVEALISLAFTTRALILITDQRSWAARGFRKAA